MAEQDKHARTPREIVRDAMGVDLEKAAAVPVSQGTSDVNAGRPQPTQQEIAEQTRLQQEARPDGRPERDDHLTHIGRGRQTTGRLGGVD